ncbi:MAG: cyclic nucleotide-binding domain-containing protein [Myxococcota bacterium]
MQETIVSTIDTSQLFQHLGASQKSLLAAHASVQSFQQGEAILEEGMNVACLYIVIQGVVRVSTASLDREIELKKLGEGAYFGEVSLLSGKEATATVEAVSEAVSVLALERDSVLDIISQDEQVRKVLEGVTLARAKDTIAKVLK